MPLHNYYVMLPNYYVELHTHTQTKHFLFMENPVTTLKTKAAAAGTNLTAICDQENIDRSTVERWKKNVPKSLVTYFRLINAIENHQNK